MDLKTYAIGLMLRWLGDTWIKEVFSMLNRWKGTLLGHFQKLKIRLELFIKNVLFHFYKMYLAGDKGLWQGSYMSLVGVSE